MSRRRARAATRKRRAVAPIDRLIPQAPTAARPIDLNGPLPLTLQHELLAWLDSENANDSAFALGVVAHALDTVGFESDEFMPAALANAIEWMARNAEEKGHPDGALALLKVAHALVNITSETRYWMIRDLQAQGGAAAENS